MIYKTISLISAIILSGNSYANSIEFINFQGILNSEHICIDGERTTGKVKNKVNVQSYYCDGGLDQRFYLVQNDRLINIELVFERASVANLVSNEYEDPWFEIRPIYDAGAYCLDVAGYDGESGDNVMYYECQGLDDQKWKFSQSGEIINKKNGLCLDIKGFSGDSNKNMQLYTCDGGLDQNWYYRTWYQ